MQWRRSSTALSRAHDAGRGVWSGAGRAVWQHRSKKKAFRRARLGSSVWKPWKAGPVSTSGCFTGEWRESGLVRGAQVAFHCCSQNLHADKGGEGQGRDR